MLSTVQMTEYVRSDQHIPFTSTSTTSCLSSECMHILVSERCVWYSIYVTYNNCHRNDTPPLLYETPLPPNSVEGATDYHLFLDLVLIGTNLYVVGYTVYILLRPLCLSIGWIKKKKVKVTPHKHFSREKTVNMLFHRPSQGNRDVG